MYSPKINESLVPKLYLLAKSLKKPMTAVVNEIIERELARIEVLKTEKEGDSNVKVNLCAKA